MVAVSTLSDLELLSLLREDDQAAFTEIYQRYKWVLFFHALKRIRNRELAKDIVQELFIALWDKRHHLDVKTYLAGYLYTSVRNRIIKHVSHQRVESDYVSSLTSSINAGICITDHRVRENSLAELIEKEINELPEKMREVFILSRKHGLNHKEIAQRLGIEETTVKRQISHALKKLRVKLGFVVWLGLLVRIL